MTAKQTDDQTAWSYFTNHAFVLLCLFRDPDIRLREVAVAVGVTERAVQRIVSELEADGVLARVRVGRRNSYTLNLAAPLRRSLAAGLNVGDLLKFLGR